jgi:glycine betaine catabolism B
MLIEPQTSPSNAQRYIPYAVIVALGYSITKLKISPEEALLIGNGFTFIFARNRRYQLRFAGKKQEAEGIYSYAFSMPKSFSFKPGQYMEWTVAHNKTDSRGNRRYLTISSSPTEPGLMFTVKHPQPASAFKQKLDELRPGDTILASGLGGSFTLPKNPAKKIALMAGGVGITPFRSMVKYMVDSGQKRDVALLYSANSEAEISFRQLFSRAMSAGLKTFFITNGYIDEDRIRKSLPDFAERRFYISGPYPFVHAVQTALLKLGVSMTDIVTDYFPGYGG